MALLKLIALEPDDLGLVSAHLQDAVLKVADLSFEPHRGRLVFLCNRFDWQSTAIGRGMAERRRAAVRIDRVSRLRTRGIDPADRSAVLSILTLEFTPSPVADAAPAGTLTVVCAGGAALQLEVECVEVALEDLGPAWRAGAIPDHADS